MSDAGAPGRRLTPSGDLVLEVLAARYRTGDKLWTFSTKVAPAIRSLEAAGLVSAMSGVTEHAVRASLTPLGEARVLGAAG